MAFRVFLFGRMILPLCMCFKYFILCLIYDYCRLGLAYAGSNREDVLALILPVLGESKANMEVQIFKLSVIDFIIIKANAFFWFMGYLFWTP